MERSTIRDDGWRACLKAYINCLNRMDAGEAVDLSDLADDAALLDSGDGKVRRLSAVRLHKTGPALAETRCRPLGVIRRDRNVRALIRLARRWEYEDGRVEERIEREKLDFVFRKGRWLIAKIERETPEKPAGASPWQEPSGPGPAPYINRQLLAPREESHVKRVPRTGTAGGDGRHREVVRSIATDRDTAHAVRHEQGAARIIRYDREAARAYADAWWNAANPKYHQFAVDCTNYVSQCLFAGGLPMDYTGRRDSGWWYEGYAGGAERWSYSWAVAHSLRMYLLVTSNPKRGTEKADPRELEVGDVIFYDWDGDGRWQHSVIVTGRDPEGWPLVNAHTNNSKRRFWDYRDSYAWSDRTRYTFIHIPDEL